MTCIGLLQQSLYSKLTGDAPLMAKIVGVYDYVPEGQQPPYLVIGDCVEEPFDTLGRNVLASSEGYLVEETIWIMSEYPGYKESSDILVELERVINSGLVVAGFSVCLLSLIRKQTQRSDLGYRFIPLTAKLILQKT